jgi:hypothetical protein
MYTMKPRYAVPIGPYLDKSALLKMGYRDASSCLVMTPISLSELWKREKANLRRGFRGRQKDLDPYFVVEEVEEATRRFTKRLQALARAEKRRQHEKTYGPRRAEIDKRPAAPRSTRPTRPAARRSTRLAAHARRVGASTIARLAE